MSECVALFTSAGAAAVSWSWSFASMGVGGWRGVRQGENQDAQCSAGRVASPRCRVQRHAPRFGPRGVLSLRDRERGRVAVELCSVGRRSDRALANTSTLIITPPHTICYNSKSHTSLTHTHSKCIALSTQARPEPAETVCRSARHENASNSDTTHSTACLGHTHKPLTRPPRARSWVAVRYLELNRPTLVRSSASLPSPAATRRASPSSACA